MIAGSLRWELDAVLKQGCVENLALGTGSTMRVTGTECHVTEPCGCTHTIVEAFVPGSQEHIPDGLGAWYGEVEAVWAVVIPGSVDFQLSNH